jgi:thiamine biosynthesis lipoprotein
MFYSHLFRAMGCDMLVILELASESEADVLKNVPIWFEEWEQSLSRFRLDSELTRLNRTFDQPVSVSNALWDVFQTAVWADDFSEGLVTPTVLDAMLEAGYDRPFDDLARDQFGMMPHAEHHPLSMIVTDPEIRTITLPKGVHLDFGGVAKGWAAHQTVERLREFGPCLMNAGGDIAVSGPLRDGSAWQIGVSDPFKAGSDFDSLHVKQGGVASSGKDRRHWKRNGVFQHHIINPNTGLPVDTDVLRVTVVAPMAMEAEAAAKTAFILGKERGLEWLETQPSFAGLMIMESGEVFITSSMPEYLQGASHAVSK